MNSGTDAQRPSQDIGLLLAILGMLAAFAPITTDMYLPGFHQMAEEFGVSEAAIGSTLSIFFLGLAVGQAIYGPLIDRWGRRGPLLAGIGIYIAATLLCLVCTDIRVFTALRFVQAAGGAAGVIVGRTIVRDLFDTREGARALSLLMTITMLAPILAPVLGGAIVTLFGWRANFVFMLGFGLACAMLVWWRVPETLHPDRRRRDGPLDIARAWAAFIGNRRFIVPALVGGLAQACMFAFITGSPFVFMNLHGASAQAYGWLFALIACSLIICSLLNRAALKRRPPQRLLGMALLANVMAAGATVLAVQTHSLIVLLIPLWLTIGTLGFTGANAAAVAMSASGAHPGSASSLIGVLQFGLAFVVSGLVAAAQNGTAYPMTLGLVACGALASCVWFLARPAQAGT